MFKWSIQAASSNTNLVCVSQRKLCDPERWITYVRDATVSFPTYYFDQQTSKNCKGNWTETKVEGMDMCLWKTAGVYMNRDENGGMIYESGGEWLYTAVNTKTYVCIFQSRLKAVQTFRCFLTNQHNIHTLISIFSTEVVFMMNMSTHVI